MLIVHCNSYNLPIALSEGMHQEEPLFYFRVIIYIPSTIIMV